MSEIHRPRRGSLAYSPRKRAKSQVPKYHSWPQHNGEPVLQGFAGYKVGMTHMVMVDDHKKSPSEGKDIMVPVTIVEIPAMVVIGIRLYRKDTFGKRAYVEAWSEEGLAGLTEAAASGKVTDVFAITKTQPAVLTGVPKKSGDIMEMRVAGGSIEERVAYAVSLFGTEIELDSVLKTGQFLDVTAITTGKGTNGPVKRWGIQTRKGKHSRGGKKRHIGNLGPWFPHHVRWQVPQMGQMGYQQRTEFNKRLLKIGESGEEINPAGGFTNYGLVRGRYVAIKGSVPGPCKRLIRMRPAIRQSEHVERIPAIQYISVASKQG
ncbi:50S ribosomal protein L3 [Methanogenium sp. S4BF]|uniref:50S ribosomal protein L3 n=1 Tax=Methanogenium sp. S4BF TaxID=1789226 RepID=UPI002417C01B|nr:50S ribosomal protein L3 [Methanogenium sp. S4BF]WFN33564.1 50S ribosomal protein L3 [Methanogenium sp. S4BF]